MSFKGVGYFSEGVVVGRISEFETIEQFLSVVKQEYPGDYDIVSESDVVTEFVRFYIHPPEEFGDDFPNGCYALCDKGRGAFECFAFDTRRLGASGQSETNIERGERNGPSHGI